MPVIQEKKMRFSNSSSHTQDTKQDRVMMMRRIQQRGMISFQKTSNVSRFFTTRTNQNRMLLQKTALRYCSTESLRQEIAVLRDQIEALQHRNAIGLQRFRDVNVMSLEDLTKERTILHFTESQRRVVELISLEDKARPVGSYRYLAMAHPRDIAMVEEMIWKNCTRKDASKRAAERFANIARRISLEKNVYLSDFKIGFDERLRHGITLSENPEDFDTKLAANEIRSLREQKLIGERKHDEMLYLVDLLSSAESESELRETWINFRESIRQLYTLRWRLGELLIGRKRLADGTELPLWQAIYDSNSVLKVDIWAEVVDELGHKKFSLVTNFFTLDYEYEDSEEEGSPLKRGSLTMPFEKNYRHNIAEDIEKYKGKSKKNSMRLARRLWLKAVMDEDENTLRDLYPLFSSPMAALSQIRAESKTIRVMAEKLGLRQGLILDVLDRLVSQAMGFNKRIRCNLPEVSVSTSDDDEVTPYGIREKPSSAKLLGSKEDLQGSVDALLNPIYYEAKFQLADEGIHGGYVKKTFCLRLSRLEQLLHEVVEEYTFEFLHRKGIYPE